MMEFPREGIQASVVVGLEHWKNGETTLTVDSNGAAAIVNHRAGQVRRYEGTLTAEELTALAAAMNGFEGWLRDESPREPGDVPVKMRLVGPDGVISENNRFSYNDRFDFPQLNQVIGQFNLLVHQLSGGALTL